MTKWSNPECEARILIKLLLSMTYIFIVFLWWVSSLVHDAIQIWKIIQVLFRSSNLVCNMTSFNSLASRSVSCTDDVLQFRIIIMHRIYQIGNKVLTWNYKAPIGKGTLSVSEKLHPLYRLVYILTYHAVCYVYEWCVGNILHAYNE